MNEHSSINRFLAASGTVLLLGFACVLGFLASDHIHGTANPAQSSSGLVVQVAGILLLICFLAAAATSNLQRALAVASDDSQE